eukprot:s1820_g5.t1
MELEKALVPPCLRSKLFVVVLKPTHGGVEQGMEMKIDLVTQMWLDINGLYNRCVQKGDLWKFNPENGGGLQMQPPGGLLELMGRWMIRLKMLKKEHQWHLSQGCSDQWSRAVPGWLIRIHGKKRSRLFHPLHHKTPNLELDEERTTILFTEDDIRVERKYRWTSSSGMKTPEETHGKQSRGFTFFRVKPRATRATLGDDPVEDDRWGDEMVGGDEGSVGSLEVVVADVPPRDGHASSSTYPLSSGSNRRPTGGPALRSLRLMVVMEKETGKVTEEDEGEKRGEEGSTSMPEGMIQSKQEEEPASSARASIPMSEEARPEVDGVLPEELRCWRHQLSKRRSIEECAKERFMKGRHEDRNKGEGKETAKKEDWVNQRKEMVQALKITKKMVRVERESPDSRSGTPGTPPEEQKKTPSAPSRPPPSPPWRMEGRMEHLRKEASIPMRKTAYKEVEKRKAAINERDEKERQKNLQEIAKAKGKRRRGQRVDLQPRVDAEEEEEREINPESTILLIPKSRVQPDQPDEETTPTRKVIMKEEHHGMHPPPPKRIPGFHYSLPLRVDPTIPPKPAQVGGRFFPESEDPSYLRVLPRTQPQVGSQWHLPPKATSVTMMLPIQDVSQPLPWNPSTTSKAQAMASMGNPTSMSKARAVLVQMPKRSLSMPPQQQVMEEHHGQDQPTTEQKD